MTDEIGFIQTDKTHTDVQVFLEEEDRNNIKKIGLLMMLYGVVFLLYTIISYLNLFERVSDSSDFGAYYILIGNWGVFEFTAIIIAAILIFLNKIRKSIYLLIIGVLCSGMYYPIDFQSFCWLSFIYKIPPIIFLSYFIIKLIKSSQFRDVINK